MEKKMKKIFSISVFVFVAAIISLAFKMNPADEPAGKQIFIDSKCTTCHSVKSAGIVKGKKDLSEVGNTLKAEQIASFITKKEKINDKLHMVAFKGDEKQLAQLTEWLASLKTTAEKK